MGGVKSGNKRKKVEERKDYVSWFEIPAIDFQQAVEFYQYIFGITMQQNINTSNSMAFFLQILVLVVLLWLDQVTCQVIRVH